MPNPKKTLRRTALLTFPSHSLKASVLDEIVAAGFTDVGAGVAAESVIESQGFSLEQGRELAVLCQQRGLGLVAFTGYQIYFPERIALEDPKRLLVTSDGHSLQKPYQQDADRITFAEIGDVSLCPFQPKNKAWYLEQLLQISRWPATCEIHLNDEASLAWFGNWKMGCYCDYCRAQFREVAGADPPVERDWDDPLWYAWIEYRFDQWIAVHAEFRAEIHKVRSDIAVGQQHSPAIPERMYNAYLYGIDLARQVKTLDVVCTDPYHYNHAKEFNHRPHRRILTEGVRSLMGAAYGCQVDIYTQAFMPNTLAVPMGRQDGLLEGVVPFALGADMVVPFTYELMKIIPGFFEAFQDTRNLLPVFAAHDPYAFATVVMPHQSEVRGHHQSHWGIEHLQKLVDIFYQTGLSWRWCWDGRLTDDTSALKGPLILPEAHCLTAEQIAAVQTLAGRGEGLLWIGNMPDAPWSGSGSCPLPAPIEYGTFPVDLDPDHPLTAELSDPLVLASCVEYHGPPGEVVGTIEGRPALVLREADGGREAWIAGIPIRDYAQSRVYRFNQPTSSIEVLQRLILWTANATPLMRLDPYPPPDEYRTLRPSDRRNMPPVELLPMIGDETLLAIVFPYVPLGCQTSLLIELPSEQTLRSVVDLWSGRDWTDRVEQGDGVWRIPLDIPGDLEFLALSLACEEL